VARFRKTAIAAVALSALALTTTTVAYAHDLGLNRVAGEASTASSMTWAYYSGDLTDIWAEKDVFEGARATAMMVGVGDGSHFRVQLRGLGEKAIHEEYGAHLHSGPCGITNPKDPTTATVGPHYNISPLNDLKKPTVVNKKTEVWLNFHVNSDRTARATANVPFVPTPGPRSITFHALPTVHHQTEGGPAVGTAGDKLACLPLDIKKFAGSNK